MVLYRGLRRLTLDGGGKPGNHHLTGECLGGVHHRLPNLAGAGVSALALVWGKVPSGSRSRHRRIDGRLLILRDRRLYFCLDGRDRDGNVGIFCLSRSTADRRAGRGLSGLALDVFSLQLRLQLGALVGVSGRDVEDILHVFHVEVRTQHVLQTFSELLVHIHLLLCRLLSLIVTIHFLSFIKDTVIDIYPSPIICSFEYVEDINISKQVTR